MVLPSFFMSVVGFYARCPYKVSIENSKGVTTI